MTLRRLLALGVSGGIVPCPSALVVLLSAIALHRVELGLLLLVAFSMGLASTLVGIGVLVVRAGRLMARTPLAEGFARIMPVISAGIITVIGCGIAAESFAATGFLGDTSLLLQTQALVVLGLGLFLGLKHATDADHIVAVTTFVSESKSVLRSCGIGVFWGIGHTLSLALAGLIVIVFKVSIPKSLEARLEFVVALMLVALGARVLIRTLRGKIELHGHAHSYSGIVSHSHLPLHTGSEDCAHDHVGWAHLGLRPLLVGMVHGAAGSSALMLLVLSTIRSPLEAFLYVLVFGFGSVLGMLLISCFVALPLHWAKGRMATGYKPIQLAAGLFSCLFGLCLGFEIWSSML
jgi:ABC-type nickel/cobalt efflux system permease component RcnA